MAFSEGLQGPGGGDTQRSLLQRSSLYLPRRSWRPLQTGSSQGKETIMLLFILILFFLIWQYEKKNYNFALGYGWNRCSELEHQGPGITELGSTLESVKLLGCHLHGRSSHCKTVNLFKLWDLSFCTLWKRCLTTMIAEDRHMSILANPFSLKCSQGGSETLSQLSDTPCERPPSF